MRPIKRLIVLDTSVLVKDFRLVGAGFRTLRELPALFDAQVLIPDTVVAETIACFRSTLTETLNKVMRLDQLLGRQLIGGLDIDAEVSSYRSFLSSIFGTITHDEPGPAFFQRLPSPEITHDEVVDRLLEGKRPFHGPPHKELGYRDFLIWQSIVEMADGSTPGHQVHQSELRILRSVKWVIWSLFNSLKWGKFSSRTKSSAPSNQ